MDIRAFTEEIQILKEERAELDRLMKKVKRCWWCYAKGNPDPETKTLDEVLVIRDGFCLDGNDAWVCAPGNGCSGQGSEKL